MKITPQMLGFGHRERVLILHADDFGMTDGVSSAIAELLELGAVTSASLMVPCPSFAAAAKWAARHPEYDVGLHATLLSDLASWSPVLPPSAVATLVRANGTFFRQWSTLDTIDPSDVVRETRAQLDTALAAGVQVTHLDIHKFAVYRMQHAALSRLLALGKEYRVNVLWAERWLTKWPHLSAAVAQNGPYIDRVCYAQGELTHERIRGYETIIRRLSAGISQLIAHPARDDSATRRTTGITGPWGSRSREHDYRLLRDGWFRDRPVAEDVHLTSWKQIAAILDAARPAVPDS